MCKFSFLNISKNKALYNKNYKSIFNECSMYKDIICENKNIKGKWSYMKVKILYMIEY